MNRRDMCRGHRDGIPEDPLKFLRWARNLIIQSKKNAKRWGIPDFAIMGLKMQYEAAKEAWETYGADPQPQPNPIDGYTIYWDKRRRFRELYGDCFGITLDKDGNLDAEEMKQQGKEMPKEQSNAIWMDYLRAHARANAERYGMPPEWLEQVLAYFGNVENNLKPLVARVGW